MRFRSSVNAVLAMSGGLLGLLAPGCRDAPPPSPPPVPVAVAPVERRDLPLVVHATGLVEPIRTAAVEAQATGLLTRVAFREGELVREGQVLFQLDDRPYQAELNRARAILARDLAQLVTARRERERVAELARQDYVTRQQLDQAESAEAALAATVAADSAAVEQARLNLQYATIRAPITGRAGAVLVREGNLVRAQSGQALVVIHQLSPIQVRFAVPASYLPALRARVGHALPVRAVPVGDSTAAAGGVLSFLDNTVDTLTGTVTLKARFANRDERLWPGALVRVALELAVDRGVLVVPAAAVITGQQGATLFVVTPEGKSVLRRVRVVRSDDSLAVIADNVAPGELVVTDGQLRLTDGATVAVRRRSGEES